MCYIVILFTVMFGTTGVKSLHYSWCKRLPFCVCVRARVCVCNPSIRENYACISYLSYFALKYMYRYLFCINQILFDSYLNIFTLYLHSKFNILNITLKTPDAGIPTLRKLPYGARSRYTVGTVCQRLRQKSVYRRHGVSTPGARSPYTYFVF